MESPEESMNPYQRFSRSLGYVSGYRIPKPLDTELKALSQRTGLSKLHLLEIALRQFIQKRDPLTW